VMLRHRFERTGDLTDLEAAIEAGRAAVAAIHADYVSRARHLSNLGISLRERFERTADLADVEAAIEAGRAAVAATPADHPEYAHYQANLGNGLLVRFGRTGDLRDLDETIEILEAGLDAVPADHPDRAVMLSNLGTARQTRYARTREQSDLNAAIGRLEAAVAATPTGHPRSAGILFNLGNALWSRFGYSAAQGDRDAAMAVYERAAEVDSAAPAVRIRAARAAALAAESRPGQAADLLENAVRLLPEVTPRQLRRSDQQHAIGGFAGLAGDAAAMALEGGRAVLFSQVLDVRGDLTDLRQYHPELAERFVRVRDLLDQSANTADLVATPVSDTALPTPALRAIADRHQLADELATILKVIRAKDGFASFGLPPSTDELLTMAHPGPVVSFNISRYGSGALLLTEDGITYLELPGLARKTVIERISAFQQALDATVHPGSSKAAQDRLCEVLGWLWDAAAEPVLHALGYHSAPAPGAAWPRVWWVPGGLLGLLPVHAAGYHTDSPGGPRRTVMDRVISSYTPTIRALRYARQRGAALDTKCHALVVAMPTTPGIPGMLPNVPAEVAMVVTRLPEPVVLIETQSPGIDPAVIAAEDTPTKGNVLARLPDHPIAHFACHGATDPTDPSKSLLLLHDWQSDPLTVSSFASIKLDQAQLAYLSACRTTFTGTAELIDEAIHLTSAFQLAGFPHVIGTLWEIDDRLALEVADGFYTALHTGSGALDTSRAAAALHQAVRQLRDALPEMPSLWGAFLHAGA